MANLINTSRCLKMISIFLISTWKRCSVLHWIQGAGKHKQFVANCVNKIQCNPQIYWRPVPTQENSADLGSRRG